MDKRWLRHNLFDPSILAAWALIALASSSNWVGLVFLFIAIPIVKRVIHRERSEAYYEGYNHGQKPVVVNKTVVKSKDLTEKQNEESYWG